MRMVESTKDFVKDRVNFKAGHRYVMAEDTESQIRSVRGDCMGMSYPIDSIYRPYKGQDLTGKKLLCWRTGGIGDMFFLIPVLRYLKSKYKNCVLKVASGCRGPLENLPEIDELYDVPFDAELMNGVDYHLMFQGIIESSSEISKKTHAADMFFKYFSIDSTHLPAEVKKPSLSFSKEEMEWLQKFLKEEGIEEKDYVIGIQMETSAPLRNFPKDKMKAIVDIFAKEENIKIFLVGSPAQKIIGEFLKGNYKNVKVLTNRTVREAIIIVNRYNLVIAPDTFMVQTAGALEKPLIGLYGPFPSDVRMRYFKNAIGLEPDVTCSPCFTHDFRTCIKGYPSPCFSQIKVEDVLQAADYLRYKLTEKHFSYMASFLKEPDFSEVEKYFLSADMGLCFFPGHYKHSNMIRVDTNRFASPDISDLSSEFKRNHYPFILYMNDFTPSRRTLYEGSKGMVRPGGHYIAYKSNAQEEFFTELKRDIGKTFILLYSKFDPVNRNFVIVGKRRY